MNILLDTNALIWCLADPDRLGLAALNLLANPANQVYVSAASGWEIAIKVDLGKITVPPNLREWLPEALERSRLTPLPISLSHALGVENLPPHHRDPFDRLLVAQAVADRLTILTSDEVVGRYDVPLIRY